MSFIHRVATAFFTALPGGLLILLLLFTDFLGSEPWWDMFLAVLVILSIASLFSGLILPALLRRMGWRPSWVWILMQGALSWGLALLLLGMFSLTPLCIGQENGDGINDLVECVDRASMSGLACTPLYLGLLTISAFIGGRVMKFFDPSRTGK
jgi:hypothetical protein